MSAAPTTRRRRSRAEAEREILDGALAFLAEHSWPELTVERLMRRTTLSRAAFYVYFREPRDVLLRLAAELAQELRPLLGRWLAEEGDPRENARAALEGVTALYAEHGPVLRAIAEAAAQDADIGRMTRGLIQGFVDGTAAHLRREIAAGRVHGLDPDRAATALVLMVERSLLDAFGHAPHPPREELADTLLALWYRALYLEAP